MERILKSMQLHEASEIHGKSAGGFTLVEAIVSLAILVTALLPALAALRHLTQASDRLMWQSAADERLENAIREAALNARLGQTPPPSDGGVTTGAWPVRWRAWTHPLEVADGISFHAQRFEMLDGDGAVWRAATVRLAVPHDSGSGGPP